MSSKDKNDRKRNKREWVFKVFKWVGAPTCISIIVTLFNATVGVASGWYGDYVDKPIIKVFEHEQNNFIEFEINGEYRAVSMKIRPQLIIQYRDKGILIIYLKDYYKNEFVQFNSEGKCSVQKQNEEYVEGLRKYLKEKIIKNVNDKLMVDIKEELQIYVSSVGGVSYVNNKGNVEKRYCVIQRGGIVIDYDEEDQTIIDRLYEAELRMENNINKLEDNVEVEKIIQAVSDEVKKYCDN